MSSMQSWRVGCGAALLASALSWAQAQPSADAWQARVLRVIDGDTVVVAAASGVHVTVRLAGIDAPERCQDWGAQARDALEQRLQGRTVLVRSTGLDLHHRTLATLHLADEDLNAWLVAQGHAWSSGPGHRRGPYARQERAAAQAGAGLHGDARALRPDEFRKAHGPCPRLPRR